MQDLMEATFVKGIEAHKNGHLEEAVKQFNEVLSADPHHVGANHSMGLIAVGVQDYKNGLDFFERGIQADPTEAKLWVGYIETLIKSGRIEDAKKTLEFAKGKGAQGKEFDKFDFYLRLCKFQNSTASQLSQIDPPLEFQEEIITAFNAAAFETVVWMVEEVLKFYPKSVTCLNIHGQASTTFGNYDTALISLKTALELDPHSPEVLNNLGHTYYKLGNNTKAITFLRRALKRKPDYAIAINNLGIALDKNGEFIQAVKCFEAAISGDPKNVEAYINLAISFGNYGEIEAAKKMYKKALEINCSQVDALCNLQSLMLTSGFNLADKHFLTSRNEFKRHYVTHPKSCSLEALRLFIAGDFKNCLRQIKIFHDMDSVVLANTLDPQDQKFCINYNRFIKCLSLERYNSEDCAIDKVFHLGESHCLSFAHKLVDIGGVSHQIVPKICFGVKAYHLAQENANKYKVTLKNHLGSIPKKSIVFLSVGEIDCRTSTGILVALQKSDASLETLIEKTVVGYLNWVKSTNEAFAHSVKIFNVPAPVFRSGISGDMNHKRAEVIKLFNKRLGQHAKINNQEIIDVYKMTKNDEYFSNLLFHVDNYHLGSRALPHIAAQCN